MVNGLDMDRQVYVEGGARQKEKERMFQEQRLKKPEPRAYQGRTSRSCPGGVKCGQAAEGEASSLSW